MSAPVASPNPGVEDLDAVHALQRALYRAAKADPGRRFHALYDKVHRRTFLFSSRYPDVTICARRVGA